jgi:hypothetical protein
MGYVTSTDRRNMNAKPGRILKAAMKYLLQYLNVSLEQGSSTLGTRRHLMGYVQFNIYITYIEYIYIIS